MRGVVVALALALLAGNATADRPGTSYRVKPVVVNVRAGIGTEHPVIGQLHNGDVVTQIDLELGWVHARLPDGSTGWVKYDLLQVVRPPPRVDSIDDGDEMRALALIVAVIAAYFAPTFLAVGRSHHQVGSILVLNLFLGWTLLGWVIALAMAASRVKRPEES